MEAATKTCGSCKESKPVDFFGLLARNKDGLNGRCKACVLVKTRQWKRTLPEEHLKKMESVRQAWKRAHPEKVSQYSKKFYQQNKEAILEHHKKWRDENKARCAETGRIWRDKNKEYMRKKQAEWYVKNKEAHMVRMKAWAKAHPEAMAEAHKRWQAANPDKVRAQQKRAQLKRIENLTDPYIVGLIKGEIGNWGVVVPPELVAMKKQYLLIKRKLKEANEEHN
jgi:hypothetical protein